MDPFVAEIRHFAFNFAPQGWAFCNGQLLPLSQNTALFSLLGTTYGGDGRSTFALPNLQGRIPVHAGQGPGLSVWDLGQQQGADTVTLPDSQMPIHNHSLMAAASDATLADPSNAALARGNYAAGTAKGAVAMYQTASPNAVLAPDALAPAGASQPHNNLMPYCVLNYCIALQGVFPPRS